MASSQNRLLSQLSWSSQKKQVTWTNNLPLAIREPPQSILWKPRKSSDLFHILEKNSPDPFHGIFPPIQKARPTTTWLVNELTICSVQLVSSFKSPYPSNPFPTAPGGNGGNSSLLFICQARSASRSWPCMGMWMLETQTRTNRRKLQCSIALLLKHWMIFYLLLRLLCHIFLKCKDLKLEPWG